MKVIVLTLATFLFSIAMLFAQSEKLKTNFYENGQKESEGKVYSSDPTYFEKPVDALPKDEKGRLIEATLKNGEWKSWFDNGQLRAIQFYNKGLEIGNWKSYYPNSQLETEFNFDAGVSTFYYENGQKESEGMMLKGQVLNGIWKGWHENGTLSYEGKYVNGVTVGEWKWYNEQAVHYESQYFDNTGTLIKSANK